VLQEFFIHHNAQNKQHKTITHCCFVAFLPCSQIEV